MPTRLLIAGGGPAAIETALAVQRLAAERVVVTLLAPDPVFAYRPLAVAEPFGLAPPARFSLARLARDCGFELRLAALSCVDSAARRVRTHDGDELAYDALVLATGAGSEEAIPGALTFRGFGDVPRIQEALAGLQARTPVRVAFVAAAETAWTLALYELALLSAHWAEEQDIALEPWLVTHEPRPLAVFGDQAASAVADLLQERRIRLWTNAFAELVEDGRLWLSLEGGLPVDLAIALPRPVGRPVRGVPADAHGFTPVDGFGRVRGLGDDVYAVGDMTDRPLKQGGLATQQADAAATAIAARAGAPVTPRPYRPELRAVLLTGGAPRYLRRLGHESALTDEAGWWPAHKIAGRHLAPYLAARPELREPQPSAGTALGVAGSGSSSPTRTGWRGMTRTG
jgi:sulfide:quinone oxidoreductase